MQQSWNPHMLRTAGLSNSATGQKFSLVEYICDKLGTDAEHVYDRFCALQNQQKQFQQLSQEKLAQLEDRLEEVQLLHRQTLLQKQNLIVNNAIQKKINKQEYIKQERINKAMATQRVKDEQKAIERLNQQGSKQKYKFTIDKEQIARMSNEERTNIEQVQRLVTLKDQKYADRESFRFCTEVLEAILADVDAQIELIEKRRFYERVQSEKTRHIRQVSKMDQEHLRQQRGMELEVNEKRSRLSCELADLEMQEVYLRDKLQRSLINRILPEGAPQGDVFDGLRACKEAVGNLKARVVAQTEELIALRSRVQGTGQGGKNE